MEAAWLLHVARLPLGKRERNRKNGLIEASMAKSFSADFTVKCISELLELFGGYGFTRDLKFHVFIAIAEYWKYMKALLVQNTLSRKSYFPGATKDT